MVISNLTYQDKVNYARGGLQLIAALGGYNVTEAVKTVSVAMNIPTNIVREALTDALYYQTIFMNEERILNDNSDR